MRMPAVVFVSMLLASALSAQQPAPAAPLPPLQPPRPMPAYPQLPRGDGFRVFIIPDMEGMASAVFNREIVAGNETQAGRSDPQWPFTHPDYWDHFRDLVTKEVNAAIAGARRGGARSFVVNEGHGGNLFGNIFPWDLDTAALLIRGWPKPEVMSTGIDSSFGALVMTGVHAGPHTPGIIAHAYAFDSIIVDGHWLNETGFNALVAGEFGVPIVLASGDNVAMQQAREQLGPSVITVTTKIAVGANAGVTWSPAVVRQMLRDSVAEGVRRAMRGQIQPFRLPKPYQVDLVLRRSYPQRMVDAVDALAGTFPGFQRTGDHTYHYVAENARDIARLFDMIEELALQ